MRLGCPKTLVSEEIFPPELRSGSLVRVFYSLVVFLVVLAIIPSGSLRLGVSSEALLG